MRAKLPRGTLDQLWNDPENWRLYSIYYCKSDPRIIVPKRKKWAGWTINCAHPSAWVSLLIAISYPLGLIICFAKSQEAYLLIPGLGIFTLIVVLVCRYYASTDRYEESR